MSDVARSLNRLAKWRSHYAGWQLGTRPKGDPECDAVRDFQEARLIARAELTALTGLLIEKGVFTTEEYADAVAAEADELSGDLARLWPGIEVTDDGLKYDKRAVETMKGWKP